MGGFTYRIQGLRELDAKMAQLGGDASTRIVRKGLRAAGMVFVESIQRSAAGLKRWPQRTAESTALLLGAIADDIGMRMGKDDDGLPAAIVGPGPTTRHVAHFVEYGHRLVKGGRNRKGRGGPGKVIGEVPQYPFIRTGFEGAAGTAVDTFVTTVREAVESEAKK